MLLIRKKQSIIDIFSHFVSMIFFVLIFVLEACFIDTSIDEKSSNAIRCIKGEDCPESEGCFIENRVCVPLKKECLLERGEKALQAVKDGGECFTVTDGICVSGICQVSICGDGYTDIAKNEECDLADQNNDYSAGCTSKCRIPKCGDGIVQSVLGEKCDDGNTVSGDGKCSADCQYLELCGAENVSSETVRVDEGEECDDGNANPYDACDNACRNIRWKNKVLVGNSSEQNSPLDYDLRAPADIFKALDQSIYVSVKCGILKISKDRSLVSVVAGQELCGFKGDHGLATNAQVKEPRGLFVTSENEIYFMDSLNHRIRKIDRFGYISTIAGNGSPGFSGDGGLAIHAKLWEPTGIFVFEKEIYFSDYLNNRIRKIDRDGIISTVAGNGNNYLVDEQGQLLLDDFGDGFAATEAVLSKVIGLFVDASGIYIADSAHHRIRKVNSEGIISTIAGSGPVGGFSDNFAGDGGPAVDAKLFYPTSISIIGDEFLIVDSWNHRIRKIDAAGNISTIIGTGVRGVFDENIVNPLDLSLNFPTGLSGDMNSILFVDYTSFRVFEYSFASSRVKMIAGTGVNGRIGNGGQAIDALLDRPKSVFLDGDTMYIADAVQHLIRKIDVNGVITNVAGNGVNGYTEGDLAATESELSLPSSIYVENGEIYIVDQMNHRIRKVDRQGKIQTIAGRSVPGLFSGGFSGDGGPAILAELKRPSGVFVSGGNVYISGFENHRIRKIDQNGVITSIVGVDVDGENVENFTVYGPVFVKNEEIYFPDYARRQILKINNQGKIEVLAGTGESGFSEDGTVASAAKLSSPTNIYVDNEDIYFIDSGNRRIRKIDSVTHTIQTVVGFGESGFSGDGGLAIQARFKNANSLFVKNKEIYFSDSLTKKIRKVDVNGIITTVVGHASSQKKMTFLNGNIQGASAIALLEDHQVVVATGAFNQLKTMNLKKKEILNMLGYEGGFPVDENPIIGSQADYFRLIDNASGLAYNNIEKVLFISEKNTGQILALNIPDFNDRNSWVIKILADGLVAPMGLAYDNLLNVLYVADSGSHTVQMLDLNMNAEIIKKPTTVIGEFGVPAAIDGYLNMPNAVAVDKFGDIFISDTGNHRVLKFDARVLKLEKIIGSGEAGSSGNGSPARAFAINSPGQMAFDNYGNLYITSLKSVRQVTADAAHRVTGLSSVFSVYGELPRESFPENITRCLTGLNIREDNTLLITDQCQGYVLEVSIQESID